MKKHGVLSSILFILIILLIAGCTDSGSNASKDTEPDKVNHSFLLYKESYVNEDGESIGELYIQSTDSKAEKVSEGVKQYSYTYLNDKNKVLFIDVENKLYEYQKGKEKVKLADDVFIFNGNYSDDLITYQNSESDLYIIHDGKEEKIASDVYHMDILDKKIYYSDNDGDFSVYDMESRQENDIASEVTYFQLLNQKGDIVYLNDDYMLYYQKAGEESIKVSGEEVDPTFIRYTDNSLIYLVYDGDGNKQLNTSKVSGSDVTTEQIADEVFDAEYADETFYYVNYDGNLYEKKLKDDGSTKLASDVTTFQFIDGTLYFMDEDTNLYKLTSKDEKEKIASDIYEYQVYNGDVVYLNKDHELFVNKTKIESDIQQFAFYFGNIVFATDDDTLHLMKELEDPEVVMEDLNKYSTAYYQNQIVFSNTLGFDDIAGFWKMDNGYESLFIEIKKDGSIQDYLTSETYHYMIDNAGYQSMDISSEYDAFTISMVDDVLTMSQGDEAYSATKSSKEEADQYVQDIVYQQDIEAVNSLINGYLPTYINAINFGDTYNLGYYIDEGSDIYQQQVEFVTEMYDNLIEEEILDYEILSVEGIDKDTYEAVVWEQYAIYDWNDNSEKTVEQTVTYTVKRISGSFYITKLVVSAEDSL
ncbi:TcaA NTF2-like domain-containing protein [Ornithinibacillus scapharcae]|uniref:TcaA NTF2-like domain-containing protein n=1 Tax=Ornithinibacillus scapharcae TaxID=1147159 RepID=UPI000225BD62|nr:hypothetical protein [Ornithinibacillus scapharcae]